jgi:hypothetical protein
VEDPGIRPSTPCTTPIFQLQSVDFSFKDDVTVILLLDVSSWKKIISKRRGDKEKKRILELVECKVIYLTTSSKSI